MSNVAISGVGMTRFARARGVGSFRDWAASAFSHAHVMSGLDISDIDALVVASESDFFTLQLNPSAVLVQDLGLVGVAASRVEGGGASGALAVHAAASLIMAGRARHVAVVGVEATASTLPGDTLRELYGFSFDAMTDGMTGMTSTQVYALSWQVFAAEMRLGDDQLADVTIAFRRQAMANPNAHLPRDHTRSEIDAAPFVASPYRRLHCSPLSDGAAALILSDTDHLPAARRDSPRLVGIGAATDHARLGARCAPGHFRAKQQAMQRACAMAGAAPADVGLVEVYDAYAGAALQGLHALGLTEAPDRDLRDGRFELQGALPVNLSGGLMGQGAAPGATGVAQVGTCALLLEGRYHTGAQPANPPALALADTHGGICTLAAVTLLGNRMGHAA